MMLSLSCGCLGLSCPPPDWGTDSHITTRGPISAPASEPEPSLHIKKTSSISETVDSQYGGAHVHADHPMS